MESLQKLFGGAAPIRVMRLFLLNPDRPFALADVAKKAQMNIHAARRETARLLQAKVIAQKKFIKEIPPKKGKNGSISFNKARDTSLTAKGKKGKKSMRSVRKRVSGFVLDQTFSHLYALRLLLLGADSVDRKNLLAHLRSVGKLKLVVLAGILLRDEEGRVDLLVVGDSMNNRRMESALRVIESQVGKELRYAMMDTREFNYRLGMYDKFIRDIFDYPHEKLVNKLGI